MVLIKCFRICFNSFRVRSPCSAKDSKGIRKMVNTAFLMAKFCSPQPRKRYYYKKAAWDRNLSFQRYREEPTQQTSTTHAFPWALHLSIPVVFENSRFSETVNKLTLNDILIYSFTLYSLFLDAANLKQIMNQLFFGCAILNLRQNKKANSFLNWLFC